MATFCTVTFCVPSCALLGENTNLQTVLDCVYKHFNGCNGFIAFNDLRDKAFKDDVWLCELYVTITTTRTWFLASSNATSVGVW